MVGRAKPLLSWAVTAVFVAALVGFMGFMSFSQMPPTTFWGPQPKPAPAHRTGSTAKEDRTGHSSPSTTYPPWWKG